jgi:hypothetical protein
VPLHKPCPDCVTSPPCAVPFSLCEAALRRGVIDEDLASGRDEPDVQFHRTSDEIHSRGGAAGEQQPACAERCLSVVGRAVKSGLVRVESLTRAFQLLQDTAALDELLACDRLLAVELGEPRHGVPNRSIALPPRRSVFLEPLFVELASDARGATGACGVSRSALNRSDKEG